RTLGCYSRRVAETDERAPDDLQTVQQRRVAAPEELRGRLTLTVVDGPDKSVRVDVDGTHASRILIGQSPACEVRLTDPMVSRRHAALDRDAHGVLLTDLRSTNGTFVNGV